MLNIDTHILIDFARGALSEHETQKVRGEQLVICDIVLWEIAKLNQLGRLRLPLASPNFQALLATMRVIAVSSSIANASCQLDFRSDPADELISATSVVYAIPLLTRDQRILRSKLVPFA